MEEDEDEEDFFPRPSKHVPAARAPAGEESDIITRGSNKMGNLPSLDHLPQPFGRLDLGGGPTERPSTLAGGGRRSLSSRLSSEKDHQDGMEDDNEDLGFVRPSNSNNRFSSRGREPPREDEVEAEIESLEKYRPHNYEFSKPKSEDINDLVDFYSNYRAPGRTRASGGTLYRQRSLDPPEEGLYVSSGGSGGGGGGGEPRKKFSDPGLAHQSGFDIADAYHNEDRGRWGPEMEQNRTGERRRAGGGGPTDNGFYDLDSIDPATRLILEQARQARSRPVESYGGGSSFLRSGVSSDGEDFNSLRPPPGSNNGVASAR
jgi:hypothetical protein